MPMVMKMQERIGYEPPILPEMGSFPARGSNVAPLHTPYYTMKEMKRKNHMEQQENAKELCSKNTEKMTLPDNPKTDKPYTPEEVAKVLLSTKPKELDDWREDTRKGNGK